MGQLIKRFADGSYLEYDKGSFDAWCVYMVTAEGKKRAPKDVDYFNQLKDLTDNYGLDRIYGDYVSVYDITGKQVNKMDLDHISTIANTYGIDALTVDKVFSTLYMTMIAEERKENTRLGKRIKRLGIHKLLVENASTYESANCMKGMGWRDIAELCRERGF